MKGNMKDHYHTITLTLTYTTHSLTHPFNPLPLSSIPSIPPILYLPLRQLEKTARLTSRLDRMVHFESRKMRAWANSIYFAGKVGTATAGGGGVVVGGGVGAVGVVSFIPLI